MEIAEPEQTPQKAMLRQPTTAVCKQLNGDCAIYSITNIFMREVVLLLHWNSGDFINWTETTADNCKKLVKTSPNYKYCILYTYIQRVLRKNVGSCGIYIDSTMAQFCISINRLFSNPEITADIVIKFIDESMGQDITALQQQYNLFTVPTETQEKLEYEIRLRELKYTLNRNQATELAFLFNAIKGALGGNIFGVKNEKIASNPNPTNNPDSRVKFQINPLKVRDLQTNIFNSGHYGIISLDYEETFSNLFEAILINQDPSIIDRIMFQAKENAKIPNNLINDNIDDELHRLMSEYSLQAIPTQPNVDDLEHIYETMDASVDQAPNIGHTMVIKYIFTFTDENGTFIYVIIKNSWGLEWGNGGYIIIPIEIIPHAEIHWFELKQPESYGHIQTEIAAQVYIEPINKRYEPINKIVYPIIQLPRIERRPKKREIFINNKRIRAIGGKTRYNKEKIRNKSKSIKSKNKSKSRKINKRKGKKLRHSKRRIY